MKREKSIQKFRTKQVDNFFYKYFNENVNDESFIEKIKDITYNEVGSKFIEFAKCGEIDFNKFTYMLYEKLNKNNILKDEENRNNERYK